MPVQSQEQVKLLETRRALDAEGWLSDVTILRKQLAAVDRKLHQMRLMDRLQVRIVALILFNCLTWPMNWTSLTLVSMLDTTCSKVHATCSTKLGSKLAEMIRSISKGSGSVP